MQVGAAQTAGEDLHEQPVIVSVAGDLEPARVGDAPPPVLLIHGDADQLVPYSSSTQAPSVLSDHGATAEVVTLPGAGHEITGPPTDEMVVDNAGWLRAHAAAGCR